MAQESSSTPFSESISVSAASTPIIFTVLIPVAISGSAAGLNPFADASGLSLGVQSGMSSHISSGATHPHGSSTSMASSCPIPIVSSISTAASAPDVFALSYIGLNPLVFAPDFAGGYRLGPSSSTSIVVFNPNQYPVSEFTYEASPKSDQENWPASKLASPSLVSLNVPTLLLGTAATSTPICTLTSSACVMRSVLASTSTTPTNSVSCLYCARYTQFEPPNDWVKSFPHTYYFC